MKSVRRSFHIALVVVLCVICEFGCVKVETSAGDAEQRTRSSSETATDLRSDWAQRLQSATPAETAEMLGRRISTITSQYVSFSRQIADRWREGNQGRGTPIPDHEMRQLVQGWIATEQPILAAHDDMVEYAYARMRESRVLDDETLEITRRLIEAYYGVHSAVFIPNGDVTDYEYQVDRRRGAVETLTGELERDLRRYY